MIRPAKPEDIPAILKIYRSAKRYMRATGNPTQWNGAYPQEELLRSDIEKRQLYVVEEKDAVHGVFALIFGKEPTYTHIDGAWKNDEPYGTIHRIASDGAVPGVFSQCLAFCRTKTSNLRIDTHRDNKIMQALVKANGFELCGVIHLADGSPRLAFQA